MLNQKLHKRSNVRGLNISFQQIRIPIHDRGDCFFSPDAQSDLRLQQAEFISNIFLYKIKSKIYFLQANTEVFSGWTAKILVVTKICQVNKQTNQANICQRKEKIDFKKKNHSETKALTE